MNTFGNPGIPVKLHSYYAFQHPLCVKITCTFVLLCMYVYLYICIHVFVCISDVMLSSIFSDLLMNQKRLKLIMMPLMVGKIDHQNSNHFHVYIITMFGC